MPGKPRLSWICLQRGIFYFKRRQYFSDTSFYIIQSVYISLYFIYFAHGYVKTRVLFILCVGYNLNGYILV